MVKHRFGMILILVLTIYALVPAANNGVQAQTDDPHAPQVVILNESTDAINIVAQFPSPAIHFPAENGSIFDEAHYDHTTAVGLPDLPVLRRNIEVPYGSKVAIEVLGYQSTTAAIQDVTVSPIPPVPADVAKCAEGEACQDTPQATLNQDADVYPQIPVQITNTYILRGHQIVQVEFWPVQINQTELSLELYSEINVRLLLTPGGDRAARPNPAVLNAAAFHPLLTATTLNARIDIDRSLNRDAGKGESYLIITPDAFTATLDALVELKQLQGFSVSVAPLSTIGTTAENIKSYIQYAYNNWSVPPTYVLLIGDVGNGDNTMPAFKGDSSQTVSDLKYGQVEGTDWVPDVFVGRLPARTTGQLEIMINNLIRYDALTGTEGWVKKAALLASSDANYWDLAEATQNHVIQNHTAPAGYTGVFPVNPQAGGDQLYAHSYNAGNANVVNAVNGKRSLITYTGHGSRVSWGGPYYSQVNVRNINHTGAFSVVTSFACITGDFESTESFGETWLLQDNKGAVAFIGSSSSSFWTPDDLMERAMMASLFSGEQSAQIVGAFRFAGLMALEMSRPGTSTAQSRYYWESYNLLGDPSLRILTGPKQSDFSMSAEPESLAICQNASASAQIQINDSGGYNQPVTLSLHNLPPGVQGDFATNPVSLPGTSQMTVSVGPDAAVGTSMLTVNGSTADRNHQIDLGLTIHADSPAGVSLLAPGHGASPVPVNSSFTWQSEGSGIHYHLQVALDEDFEQLVYDEQALTQPAFTPIADLAYNTTFFWRVRAVNPCGISDFSPTFSFTTVAAPGSCPAGTVATELYQTDFESAVGGWTVSGENASWARNTRRSHSPANAYSAAGQNAISLQNLTTPRITLPETYGQPITLKFWQWFNLEEHAYGCFDGAVLKITSNGGQSWSTLPESALSIPYTGSISTQYLNPLGGERGWCGSRDWTETLVDLTAYAGQEIALRFSQGTDASVSLDGWSIDDFSISACELRPDYQPYLRNNTVNVGQAPGKEITVRMELVNAGLKADTYAIEIKGSAWNVSINTKDTVSLQPGERTTLEVVVMVPADAPFGQVERVLVSVVSQMDPETPAARDETTIELMASILSFVPVVNLR